MEDILYNIYNSLLKGELNAREIGKLFILLLIILFTLKSLKTITDFIFNSILKYGVNFIYKILKLSGILGRFFLDAFISAELNSRINRQIINIDILNNPERLEDKIHTDLWFYISTSIFSSSIVFIIIFTFKLYFIAESKILTYTICILFPFIFNIDFLISHFKFKAYSKNIPKAFEEINKKYELLMKIKKLLSARKN